MVYARSILVSFLGAVALLFSAAGLSTNAAQAAPPQILGLVATASPTPLICENGKCWAEFSAFCLQQHRKAPDAKTAYVPAADTKLTLRLIGADGTVRTMDAAPLVKIESERIFLSVRMVLPEAVIRGLNGTRAAISVGKLASLVPVITKDAVHPMTAAEIAQFTGPLRAQAEHYVHAAGAGAEDRLTIAATALKLVNYLGNAPVGPVIDEEGLWRHAVGAKASEGLRQSRAALRQCHRLTGGDGYMLGECLRDVHDLNALPVTTRVWKGLRAGG
jgi:hypothetical protein